MKKTARFKIISQGELEQIEAKAVAQEEPSTISQSDRDKLAALKAKLEGEE